MMFRSKFYQPKLSYPFLFILIEKNKIQKNAVISEYAYFDKDDLRVGKFTPI